MWDNRNHSNDSRTCFASSCNSTPRDAYITKNDITWRLLDLWYFNFKSFGFIQPNLWIDTTPRWFNSPSTFNYE